MEKQTLQLLLEPTWWMWRGCLQDHYGDATEFLEHNRKSSLDQEDYEEPNVFPLQKPNFDVFGIPRRTRKQRGWYQVQRRPNAQPAQRTCSVSSSQFSSKTPATGADVPIELVRLVGEMMSKKLQWHQHDDKCAMLTCALVCRHWASQFLPKIFMSVLVHSRQRVVEMWELDRSPACWFLRFVEPQLRVNLILSELSCVHLLTRHTNYSLQLTGPLPRGWKTIRSVHQALPRSLPSSFSAGIRYLVLVDIRLQRFADLVHLVCELPDLTSVHCTKVAWGPLPNSIDTSPRRQRTQRTREHRQLTIRMDLDMWTHAGMHLLAHVVLRNGYPFFQPSAVLALTSLVDTMPAVHIIPNPDRVYSEELWGSWYDHILALRFRIALVGARYFSVHIQTTTQRTGPNGEIPALDVAVMTVDLRVANSGDHKNWWKTFEWHKLDENISTLDPTRLVFVFGSKDDVVPFGVEVADISMRHASARGSIRYAVAHRGGLYKASRDSDVLQGPFNCGLYDLYAD